MENLNIPKTKYTLMINFNVETGIFEMGGSSYPENAMEFFQPIIKFIELYVSEIGKAIILNLELNYLNTSSTKCLLDIIEILEKYYKESGDVKVNWYYEEDDEDILEMGEDIAEDIELPINLISY
ncbi:MAG: DUF1987 domain-containing protein [Candidatus Cloacimonetes bacterium]|nr:DUF1987 domain-containing protein [Candidatus Cloacimonadota bacterium]